MADRRGGLGTRRVAALACLVAVLAAPAPATSDPLARLAAWIAAELERDAAPSLAVAVARDGRVLWAQGFGCADRERRIPATADTRYSLASVSKPVTATGLMRLVERGVIDLDRPINDYLDEARLQVHVGDPRAVTVRRVAAHTAGLPVYHHFFVEGLRPPLPMAATIARYGHVISPAGDRYRYSNLGYGVLGHLIARVSGRAFGDFLRDEVFAPLGMHRTSVGIPPGERDDFAVRYDPDGSALPYYEVDHEGASAVFSSARDLALFGLLHAGRPPPGAPPPISAAAVRMMQRPWADVAEGAAYGLGWQIREGRHGRIISHGGGMPGVTASLTLVPSAGLVVVALANASSALPDLVTERVLAAFAPAVVETAITRPSRRVAPRSRPDRRLVGEWSGSALAGGRAVPLQLRVDRNGQLHARLGESRDVPLVGVSFEGADVRGLLREATLATEDARSARVLLLELTRRGDRLTGVLTASAPADTAIGFALPHWVELRRAKK